MEYVSKVNPLTLLNGNGESCLNVRGKTVDGFPQVVHWSETKESK